MAKFEPPSFININTGSELFPVNPYTPLNCYLGYCAEVVRREANLRKDIDIIINVKKAFFGREYPRFHTARSLALKHMLRELYGNDS